MNGKHGDHPLTDSLFHKREVFGHDIDRMIARLSRLMTGEDLDKLVNWLQPPPKAQLRQILEDALKRKREEAVERGWETEEDK